MPLTAKRRWGLVTDDEVDHYRCPYCPAEPYTSTKEREVRVHIELASDSEHKGREGFSPVTTVEAVDEEGSLIENTDGEEVKRNPDEFDETCEPDDDLSETERRIIATKMMNIDYTAQEVTEFLEKKRDAPHVEKVRATLRDYFGTTAIARGHRSTTSSTTANRQRSMPPLATNSANMIPKQRPPKPSVSTRHT